MMSFILTGMFTISIFLLSFIYKFLLLLNIFSSYDLRKLCVPPNHKDVGICIPLKALWF